MANSRVLTSAAKMLFNTDFLQLSKALHNLPSRACGRCVSSRKKNIRPYSEKWVKKNRLKTYGSKY